MRAWCPEKGVSFLASLGEMGSMSVEDECFVMGFLSGSEPHPPGDDAGNEDEADVQAWRSAITRFRCTGGWFGRWGTCDECGCVLLPDTAASLCHEPSTPSEP
jgi:hypothetical protein